MKKGIIHILALCVILLLCGVIVYKKMGTEKQEVVPATIESVEIEDSQLADWKEYSVIAHAGGIIDDKAYTNSLEAVLQNYEKGFRLFEIDLVLTSDNQIVSRHGWDGGVDACLQEGIGLNEIVDEATFLSIPIYGQYTPMTLGDVCRLMDEFPDMWVVTDTKYKEEDIVREQFQLLIDTVERIGLEHVLDRFIVQVYNEPMYDVVHEIYPFENWIYTLYNFWHGDVETFEQCAIFCTEKDIDVLTTWNYLANPEVLAVADKYGIPVYVHTENDVENAKKLIDMGVRGVYTDSITPEMLEQ